jgi:hypothetical protein
MHPRRILLWVFLDSHFREMVRVARLLKARTQFVPVILFHYCYPRLSEDVATCIAERIDYENLAGTSRPAARAPLLQRLKRLPRRVAVNVYRFARRTILADFLGCPCILLSLLHYRKMILQARSVLERYRPALLVFPEDNVEYNISAFVKAARERKIPSLIIPYTLAKEQEPAEAYWGNPRYQVRGFWNRLIGCRYPRWVYQHRGRKLLRLVPEQIVAQEWLGLAPPLPWVMNSSYADVVAVESHAAFRYYLQAGLTGPQMRVLGSLRQDELARYRASAPLRRQALLASLGIEDGRPLILCALPPNQRPEQRPACEFKAYNELLQFWARTIGRLQNCHVIVNPHPRIARNELEGLHELGIHIVYEDIARLIPLCDLYIASVSATICMALACGKPVINYDVYRFRYDDFVDDPQVITVEDGPTFAAAVRLALNTIDTNSAFFQNLDACAEHWGILDGNAGDRLVDLVLELTGDSLLPEEVDVPRRVPGVAGELAGKPSY